MITLERANESINKLLIKVGKNNWKGSGVAKYALIMNSRYKANFNPSNDKIFQLLFCDFYGLNSNGYQVKEFIVPYFSLFNDVLNDKNKQNIKYILEGIQRECKRLNSKTNKLTEMGFELSYASKMLHTISPSSYPIWDSKLIPSKQSGKYDHFANPVYGGIRNKHDFKDVDAAVSEYIKYVNCFNKYLNSRGNENSLGGIDLINLFDKAFPNSSITNIKKIDFILWLDREE